MLTALRCALVCLSAATLPAIAAEVALSDDFDGVADLQWTPTARLSRPSTLRSVPTCEQPVAHRRKQLCVMPHALP